MKKKTLIKAKCILKDGEKREIISSNFDERSGYFSRLWWKRHKKRKARRKMEVESRKRNRGNR